MITLSNDLLLTYIKGINGHKKTLQVHGEFSSLTITIFPSFKIKTNEILQRIFIFYIVVKLEKCQEKLYYFFYTIETIFFLWTLEV